MQTISLCIIVKDEERFLDRCLNSAAKHVNEVVLVDTGSSDRTLEIAEHYDANIFHYNWTNDFAAARNISIKHATSDYILVLDADEYLDEDADIQRVLITEKDHYTVRIKNHLSSGGAIYHPAVRLFKNNRGLKYQGRIHEHLNVEDKSLGLSHEFGDVLIHHDGYKDEVVKEKEKHNRNIAILLDEVAKNPSGYNLYNLGTQYRANHQDEEAVNYYKRAFELSKDRLYIQSLLYNMIDSISRLGRHEEALNVVNAAIESFPNHTDFYFLKGRIFEELAFKNDAIRAYENCIRLGEVDLFQTLEGVGSFLAYVRKGAIAVEKGQYVLAFDMALKALEVNKYHMPALRLYLEMMTKTHIPLKAMQEHLSNIFSVEDVKDLKHLIVVLTVIKSPLLQQYIDLYKLQLDPTVSMIAKLYSRHYSEALEIARKLGDINESESNDLFLLAYISNSEQLAVAAKKHLNISNREWKQLKRFFQSKPEELGNVSERVANIIVFIAEQLLILQEEDLFNRCITTIQNGPAMLKMKLCHMLIENRYSHIAMDLLVAEYEQNKQNPQWLELLGDVCVQENQDKDALSVYNRALELRPEYRIYEKVYEIYNKLNDQEAALSIKREIADAFPIVEWAKA
ncbi:glycosyltransferase family 2 protein [Bacillus sp. T33-2]|uniref:glycosyltransferase family 2 protein n=1 Tax=Bacillus sp. T33-2 TaxID=2054168 RepID=UPI0015E152D3|nr:glycosyltransferase family 2 protein [Bacillus sp. T33-2]